MPSIKVPLTKPITTHKGEITELEIREFTAADMVEARMDPQSVSQVYSGKGTNAATELKMEVRYDVCMALLAKATGIDEILLGAMSGRDFQAASKAVVQQWNAAGE